MRRLLSRIPFTFIVLGGWLAYEAYRGATGQTIGGSGRLTLFMVASVLSFLLAAMGFRERYRPRDPHL